MCCSDETISSDRVGARVDFFTPSSQGTRGHVQMIGNLLFLDPSCPTSSSATHVWFTTRDNHYPITDDEKGVPALREVSVSIQLV